MNDTIFEQQYRELDNYQALIVRWLRGANAGECGPLYISSRGKGTSLFIRNETGFGRRRNQTDIRLAVLQRDIVKILTIHDSLGIAKIAKGLNVDLIEYNTADFKSDGTLRGGQ